MSHRERPKITSPDMFSKALKRLGILKTEGELILEPPLTRKKLGNAGEDAAAAFLETRGFTILERNFRTRHFEIDIIARDRETICFIEVKTRSNLKKGLPREGITPAKQKKIITGATFYLKSHGGFNQRLRFDVVEVLLAGGKPEITLIQNAFQGV